VKVRKAFDKFKNERKYKHDIESELLNINVGRND